MRVGICGVVMAGWLGWVAPATADVVPEPAVPSGWDQHASARPMPSPEKELPVILALLGVVGGAGLWMLRRSSHVATG